MYYISVPLPHNMYRILPSVVSKLLLILCLLPKWHQTPSLSLSLLFLSHSIPLSFSLPLSIPLSSSLLTPAPSSPFFPLFPSHLLSLSIFISHSISFHLSSISRLIVLIPAIAYTAARFKSYHIPRSSQHVVQVGHCLFQSSQ